MDYSLATVDRKVRELADKMGSDYFPLPVFVNRFEKAAYDFIGERLKVVEKTQEITDDIRPLIRPNRLALIVDPNENVAGHYVAGVPADYLRLLSVGVIFPGEQNARRVTKARHGEVEPNRANPYKEPTNIYPMFTQYDSYFKIECSATPAPTHLKISYAKMPTIPQPTSGVYDATALAQRIINLPDDAILEIMLDTVTSLFSRTGDERSQSSYQLEESFRKVFR